MYNFHGCSIAFSLYAIYNSQSVISRYIVQVVMIGDVRVSHSPLRYSAQFHAVLSKRGLAGSKKTISVPDNSQLHSADNSKKSPTERRSLAQNSIAVSCGTA